MIRVGVFGLVTIRPSPKMIHRARSLGLAFGDGRSSSDSESVTARVDSKRE